MYRIEVENQGSFNFKARSGNYEFLIGLDEDSISPPALLLTSLASCLGVYARKYAEGVKIKLGQFNIMAEGELSREKPICFRLISVSIDLKGAMPDKKRRESLLRFVKNCPIHNTLANNSRVETVFSIAS